MRSFTTPVLGVSEGLRAVLDALDRTREVRAEMPSGAGRAHLAWALWEAGRRPAVWVTDGPHTLDLLLQDLAALAGGRRDRMAGFPAREGAADPARARDPELAGERLETLRRCRAGDPPAILATCVQALLQPTVAPEELDRCRFALTVGGLHGLAALVRRLAEAGYEFTPQVQAKGEASVRGGILDLWPPALEWPVRAEFAGEQIDSLRSFDPWQQRSRERLARVEVTPPRDAGSAAASLFEYLAPDALRVWVDPEQLEEHAGIQVRAAAAADAAETVPELAAVQRRAAAAGGGDVWLWPAGEAGADAVRLDLRPLAGVSTWPSARRGTFEPDALASARAAFVREMTGRASAGHAVVFAFATEGARDRFRELYLPAGVPPGVELRLGAVSEGFEADGGRLTVVAESDLYGRRDLPPRGAGATRRGRPAEGPTGERITDWASMEPGEMVVHVEHGIGRYLGLYEIEFNGREQEALAVEYAEGAKLYVPVAQAHLLSRYVGFGRRTPELHRLGAPRWRREKEAAERAVRDLAAQLLETQGARQTRPGYAFKPDTPWQHEFEAGFPFAETDDQRQAIEDVRRDMESPRPMDRLICGDVGYGKTEVAMRAAFKAVMEGKQVAMLVPTTVLAQQHYDTFCQRMAAFPVSIEMLSRFRSRGEQQAVVRRLREGGVDIVIGTHRLVQSDVAFRDLGLVIVDEEQRFGVAHKESLKQLRATVDVLTLTATPIPRTLYLSLTGARDLSVIQTPPRERLPIETVVCPHDDAVVREAILRELSREGQVFYLHNRVLTIHDTCDRLRRLVPEARVELAHGQMAEHELADIMHRFVRGEFDVLLCTTIIESGVDIPRVNTILIERADRFGVADLYQLRGRVGRFKHRAYAYLLLPRHGRLFDTARQRIGALRRHAGLGAGFKLALRDLETRGAGNILGAEQSGHIAAVGFDLYCQLLRRTVATMKGEAPPPVTEVRVLPDFLNLSPSAPPETAAVIPPDYVEDETQRLQLYRRLAAAASEHEVRALADELRDRFGPRPRPAERLFKLARIRLRARAKGVTAVETDGDKLVLTRDGEYWMPEGRYPRLRATGSDARLDEILRLLGGL